MKTERYNKRANWGIRDDVVMKLCKGKGYARRERRGRGVLGIGQDLSEEIVKRSLFVFEETKFQFAAARTAKRIKRERSEERKSSDKLVQDVMAYLEEHYAEYDTCLSTVALHFGLTEKYFSAFFKEKTGVSFANYLEDIRIDHAEKLLQEDKLTIEEISQPVGYSSSRTFRRA